MTLYLYHADPASLDLAIPAKRQPLRSIMGGYTGAKQVAIRGGFSGCRSVFFDWYTGCGLMWRSGVQFQGRTGKNWPCLLVDADGKASIVRENQRQPYETAKFALAAGPQILRKGTYYGGDEHLFPDIRPLSKAGRSFVAVTADGSVLLGVCAATVTQTAEWLRASGAIDAMLLDGGHGTQIWDPGGIIATVEGSDPVSIPNALVAGQATRIDPPETPQNGSGAVGANVTQRINDVPIAPNFRLYEFESPDTLEVMVDPRLVARLQSLRDALGKPIKVTSGYRTPEHNASPTVGGEPDSQHLCGKAADIVVSGVSVGKLAKLAAAAGFTGIGTYNDGHLHVDVRDGRARWSG